MQGMVCDECGKAVDTTKEHVRLIVFTPEPIADPSLDLCDTCSAKLRALTTVKSAREKARAADEARAKAFNAAAVAAAANS